MKKVDVIVLGTGGVGIAALAHLAGRGAKVLGIDRFGLAHDRGSSHGETRIIRLAYFEGPDYVPLLRRSYTLWEELSARRGQELYQEVGLLQVGPAGGEIVRGVRASAQAHDLEVEDVDPRDAAERFPAFRFPEGTEAVFERRAGFLLVEDCIRAYAAEAEAAGAELRSGETVRSWRAEGEGVVVVTDQGEYGAERLVITAGAWAGDLLAGLGIPLQVARQPLFWFEADAERHGAERGCPGFLFEVPRLGLFYGFPRVGPAGVKVAEHHGGPAVDDPLALDRSLWPENQARVEAFLRACMPHVSARRTQHAVCMYTNTPDEQFLVDVHPEHRQVCFAAGLSGHGFKMASGLGEVLADLALTGASTLPLGFLGCQRFQREGSGE